MRDLPLARVIIHGRTKAQGYRGEAQWAPIEWAARELPVPVFGSGDVVDRPSLQAKLSEAPSIAGVFIGRGAIANPRVFRELERVGVLTNHAWPKLNRRSEFLACFTTSIESTWTVS